MINDASGQGAVGSISIVILSVGHQGDNTLGVADFLEDIHGRNVTPIFVGIEEEVAAGLVGYCLIDVVDYLGGEDLCFSAHSGYAHQDGKY